MQTSDIDQTSGESTGARRLDFGVETNFGVGRQSLDPCRLLQCLDMGLKTPTLYGFLRKLEISISETRTSFRQSRILAFASFTLCLFSSSVYVS